MKYLIINLVVCYIEVLILRVNFVTVALKRVIYKIKRLSRHLSPFSCVQQLIYKVNCWIGDHIKEFDI